MAHATDRADLLHCLAAAFLPPPQGLSTRDWCLALGDDLGALGASLDLPVEGALAALRKQAGAGSADEPWLVEYSRLFLVPPVRVTLNAGVYLEGGLAGVSARMIAECYARAGLECRTGFGDLPDHVAAQLEFLAELQERAAAGDAASETLASAFVADFVDHWAQPLRDACRRASSHDPSANVYAELASLVGIATRG